MIRSLFYYFMGLADTLVSSLKIAFLSVMLERGKWLERVFGEIVKDWGKRMVGYTGTKVKVEGMEHIEENQAYLVLVNHQSNFDIYLILGYIRLHLCFISKQFYFKIPFIGKLMNEMGCISINRNLPKESLKSMEEGAKRLMSEKSVVIYPEGRRSRDGEIKPFKRGFLHLIEAKVKSTEECWVLPVTLSGSKNIQTKGEYKVKPSNVLITISSPIRVKQNSINTTAKKNELFLKIEETIKRVYQPNIRKFTKNLN